MKKENQKRIGAAVCMLAAFALWTAAVCMVDVQPIGPDGSAVGMATINAGIHRWTGVHMPLYRMTDWLSLVPLGFAVGFALLGLAQWIRRKSLKKVDRSLLVLGGFYLAVLAVYGCFEIFVVNVRPIWIEGRLEASYPSSTTLLVMCMMPTAVMQLNNRIQNGLIRRCVAFLITVFSALMIMCRLVSGVHWFSDIVGGALLSAGLVGIYGAMSGINRSK